MQKNTKLGYFFHPLPLSLKMIGNIWNSFSSWWLICRMVMLILEIAEEA